MQKAIEKAKLYGLGAVAVRNSTHFGIDGYYALMAVKENMAGLSFTNARPSIAPTFGVEPMLGTNPIAFGAPTDQECPFLFDAATSIIQRGKVEVYDRAEKSLEEGYVINQDGQPMTDPEWILKELGKKRAAFLPLGGEGEIFAGYKGYDLATMVEIFRASFQNGSYLGALSGVDETGKSRTFNVGHYFMAFNIEFFTDIDQFKRTTGGIIRELQASKKAPGQEHIYFAGEKEFLYQKQIYQLGIPINSNLQKEIIFIQKELDLRQFSFPF
jgi:LDH2 family malate/lactate/ureidoglycolate dehydrogenase